MTQYILSTQASVINLLAIAQPSNVSLTWDEILTAPPVAVYRSDTDDRAQSSRIGQSNTFQLVDNDVKPGTEYFYWAITLNPDGSINTPWSSMASVIVPYVQGSDADMDTFFEFIKTINDDPVVIQGNIGWQEIYATPSIESVGSVMEFYISCYSKMISADSGVNRNTVIGYFKGAFEEETAPGVWTLVNETQPLPWLQVEEMTGSMMFIKIDPIHLFAFVNEVGGGTYRARILSDVVAQQSIGSEVHITNVRAMVRIHKSVMNSGLLGIQSF
jgi:hypothetical protein